MKNFLRSDFASPVISALIWIVITLATGGSLAFAFIGAAVLMVVVYAIQEAYRRITGSSRSRL